MPRTFTEAELMYIDALSERNSNLIAEENPLSKKLWKTGLNKPMPNWERKMRQRIRKKIITMAVDLCNVYHAGIAPHGEIKPKSANDLVNEMSWGITAHYVKNAMESKK